MRFLASKTGTVHVVDRSPSDKGATTCPAVSRALNAGSWKGQRSLKPEDVVGMNCCLKCDTNALARAEVRKNKVATRQANAGVTVIPARRQRRESPVSKVRKAAAKAPATADERTTQKAKEHAELATEHGWSVSITANTKRGLTVVASRGDEVCVLAYRENGILWNDEIVFKVPGRVVPMHNSGTWRRQVSLPEGKRPIPARPKRFVGKVTKGASGPKVADEVVSENGEVSEEEAIPLNKSSLPFNHDDEDLIIIEHIKGKTLYWRNNMLAKVVSAQVPAKTRMIRFGNTGRAQRRYVSFPESAMTSDGEVYGPERCVAVEDMLRVR